MSSMPDEIPIDLEDRPYAPDEVRQIVTREVRWYTGVVDRSWRDMPGTEDAGPSLPAPRHGLTLLQGGAS